ncbi:MAG: TIGR04086 family membrane protein [Clostridia bacterium]
MENTKHIFKGVAISLISTMILLLIFSVILTYTNVSENTITPVIIIVTAIGILVRKFNC